MTAGWKILFRTRQVSRCRHNGTGADPQLDRTIDQVLEGMAPDLYGRPERTLPGYGVSASSLCVGWRAGTGATSDVVPQPKAREDGRPP